MEKIQTINLTYGQCIFPARFTAKDLEKLKIMLELFAVDLEEEQTRKSYALTGDKYTGIP